MSKKAVLFSTRFLEKDGMLFDASSLVKCEHAFESNIFYGNFFLNDKIPKDLQIFLCEEYYKRNLGCLLKDVNVSEESLSNIMTKVRDQHPQFTNIINDIRKVCRSFKLSDIPKTFSFPQLKFEEGLPSLLGEVPKNELIQIIRSNISQELNQLRINIDSEVAYPEMLKLRFKLYKLEHGDKTIKAYAVWPLHDPCSSSMTSDWYNALCTEIINDNKEEGEIDIDEIFLILHDGDIKPHTTFNVRERNVRNSKYSFLPDGISLNIALFQHSNDPIASLLINREDNKSELIKKAIGLISSAKCGTIVYELLADMDDLIALWHTDSPNATSDFKDKAVQLKQSMESNLWTECFQTVQSVLDGTKSIGDVLDSLNREINNAIRKLQRDETEQSI